MTKKLILDGIAGSVLTICALGWLGLGLAATFGHVNVSTLPLVVAGLITSASFIYLTK